MKFTKYIFCYFLKKTSELDLNACGTDNGGCSHLCLRNSRGYTCKCPTGTKLKDTSTTDCEILPNNYLLVALRSGIGRISLDTNELFDVVLPIDNIHGVVVLDYHYNQSKLLYADVNIDTITIVDMKNLTDTKTIVSSGIHTPNGIAVDWVANNFYWTDSGNKVVGIFCSFFHCTLIFTSVSFVTEHGSCKTRWISTKNNNS